MIERIASYQLRDLGLSADGMTWTDTVDALDAEGVSLGQLVILTPVEAGTEERWKNVKRACADAGWSWPSFVFG